MKGILSRVGLLTTVAILTASVANAQQKRRVLKNKRTKRTRVVQSGRYHYNYHNDDYYYNDDYYDYDSDYEYTGSQYGTSKVVHRVNRYMSQGDSINLGRAFARKMGPHSKMISVKVVAQSHSYNAKVVLKSVYAGRIGVIKVGAGLGHQSLQIPSHTNLRDLKLVVKGSMTIKRVVAQVVQNYNSQAQLLKAQVRIQTQRGVTVLPVKRIVKQNTGVQLRNKKIKAVIVKARSLRNAYGQGSTIQVLVNGMPTGRPVYVGPQMQRVKVPLGYVQTQGATIKLKVTGKTAIKMIGLKVKDQFGYGY